MNAAHRYETGRSYFPLQQETATSSPGGGFMTHYGWHGSKARSASLGVLCWIGFGVGCAGNTTPEMELATAAPMAGAAAVPVTPTQTTPANTTSATNTTPP